MRSKMERKHIPYFCEKCGREEFEGIVFGQEVEIHLQAESGSRTLLCNHCRPQLNPVTFKLSPFFTEPLEL